MLGEEEMDKCAQNECGTGKWGHCFVGGKGEGGHRSINDRCMEDGNRAWNQLFHLIIDSKSIKVGQSLLSLINLQIQAHLRLIA